MQSKTPTSVKTQKTKQNMKRKSILTLQLRNSLNRSLWRGGFFLVPLVLACFALSPRVQAVTPAPDGAYGGGNTAEGADALANRTTGIWNTALGFQTLFHNTTGNTNTATGFQALFTNVEGVRNTATGLRALLNNTGDSNVGTGWQALIANTVGDANTAIGSNALVRNTSGNDNIAVGTDAGFNLTTGDNNIDIGNNGVADESMTTRIGSAGFQSRAFIAGIIGAPVTGSTVVVNAAGQLGVLPSSERFKDEIKPMDKASEVVLALKPVTFRYKRDVDPKGTPQFGLVAEEVAKVNPDLVTRDAKGEIYTVRYEAVNAMLLNEFLKEHHKVETLETTVAQQQKSSAQQQAQIETLTSGLQKVSTELEMSKRAPQVVTNP
jgi:uncharacterized coiled-coil protein SlyX